MSDEDIYIDIYTYILGYEHHYFKFSLVNSYYLPNHNIHIYTHTYKYLYIYIYMYIFISYNVFVIFIAV